jgi:hypothetical protein
MKRFLLVTAGIALTAGILIPTTSQADTLVVPQAPWPVCSSVQLTWCVSAVSIQAPGQTVQNLTWVPSGTAAPSMTTTATPTTPAITAEGSTEFSGFWSSSSWPDSGLGFGGLFVQAEAANQFSNYMLFNVLPAIQDPTSANVYVADAAGSEYPASLSPDDVITVSLETGNADAGVSMAIGNNFSDSVGSDANGTNLTFSATPVPVAIASSTSQCVGETGVAAAETTQLQVLVAPTNDPTSGFGVPGVSGKMYVESNGACALSSPVWNASSLTMQWTVGAPHFLPDGATINQGYYQAMIPGADATLLWGLTNINQAASALTVSETSPGQASNTVAISSVSVKNGNIIISSTGFDFSSPTFKVARNPKYNFHTVKKRTILCVRGKSRRRITAVHPTCPRGYRIK